MGRGYSSQKVAMECFYAGDELAFSDLYNYYKDRLFGFAFKALRNRETAEEMVQETFMRVYNSRDGRKYSHDYSVSTWVYTICLNLIRSEMRKRKIRGIIISLDEHVGDGEDLHSAIGSDRDLKRISNRIDVREVLDYAKGLPEGYRRAFGLDVLGTSYEDAAEILGIPVGTYKSRLHRARKEIRNRFGSDGNGTDKA